MNFDSQSTNNNIEEKYNSLKNELIEQKRIINDLRIKIKKMESTENVDKLIKIIRKKLYQLSGKYYRPNRFMQIYKEYCHGTISMLTINCIPLWQRNEFSYIYDDNTRMIFLARHNKCGAGGLGKRKVKNYSEHNSNHMTINEFINNELPKIAKLNGK